MAKAIINEIDKGRDCMTLGEIMAKAGLNAYGTMHALHAMDISWRKDSPGAPAQVKPNQ